MVVLLAASPAAAQGPGVRGGVSVDPDQVYFGGHYETSELVDRLHFRPNIELGLGDDLITTALNMEFVYKFPTRTDWGLYVGGGPAVNFYSFDNNRGGDTVTDGGLNVLFGVENRQGLMFEVKIGAIDSPDIKFGVGWTFR
jgi:hypothetical protein